MPPALADLLPVALLGGVLGLDVVSFPQAMLSRPVVAATVAGAFAGDPLRGLLLGVTLELFALETLPFGASRYPEWGSASVVGGALFATGAQAAPGAFAVAVLATLAMAWLGGISMVWLRRLNAHFARERLPALDSGSGRTVVGLQLYGMTADLVRGTLLTGLGLLVWGTASASLLVRWDRADAGARAMAVGLAAMVATAAAWKLFHGVPHARALFGVGLAIGLLLLVVA